MWLLLSLLGAYTAFANAFLLWHAVQRLAPRQVKRAQEWWFRCYKTYPSVRHTCWPCARPLLDRVFALDRGAHGATVGETSRDRVCIRRALLYRIGDPGRVKALRAVRDASAPLTWASPAREPVPEERGWEEGLRGGAPWALQELVECGVGPFDCTERVAARWAADGDDGVTLLHTDELVRAGEAAFVYIKYCGHADGANDVAAQDYHVAHLLFDGESVEFPPEHPAVASTRGMRARQVLYATLDGADVTAPLRAACGPMNDFHANSATPITYCTLWFMLWMSTGHCDLGHALHIEDSHLDTTEM
jgi:hypothetical protein